MPADNVANPPSFPFEFSVALDEVERSDWVGELIEKSFFEIEPERSRMGCRYAGVLVEMEAGDLAPVDSRGRHEIVQHIELRNPGCHDDVRCAALVNSASNRIGAKSRCSQPGCGLRIADLNFHACSRLTFYLRRHRSIPRCGFCRVVTILPRV